MTAWDALLDRVDAIVDARLDVDPTVQDELTALLVGAMRDGTADRELDPGQAGLWIAALLRTHSLVQDAGEDRADDALSMLRVILTRWLHPGRLDQAPPTFAP